MQGKSLITFILYLCVYLNSVTKRGIGNRYWYEDIKLTQYILTQYIFAAAPKDSPWIIYGQIVWFNPRVGYARLGQDRRLRLRKFINNSQAIRPLQIDFACGRAVNSIIPFTAVYVSYHTCTQFDTIIDALYMSIYKITW